MLNSFRAIPDTREDSEWKAANEIVRRVGGYALALNVNWCLPAMERTAQLC